MLAYIWGICLSGWYACSDFCNGNRNLEVREEPKILADSCSSLTQKSMTTMFKKRKPSLLKYIAIVDVGLILNKKCLSICATNILLFFFCQKMNH